MAILTAGNDFDPTVQPSWTVFYASGSASQFSMWDNLKTQSFTGSFTYPDSTHVRGTVKSLELNEHAFAERHVVVTGLAVDAASVQTKVIAGSGLYGLLLAGDDTINGGKRLFGYAGNDKLILSSGTYADGGAGIDTLAFRYQTQASLLTHRSSWTSGESTGSATLANIEHLSGSAYNDTLAGDAADNVLDGLGGVDTVSYAGLSTAVVVDLSTGVATGQGRDTLKGFENAVGGAGADLLIGNSLGNRLEGGAGVDTLKGGLGNDTYCASDTQDVFVEAADGGIDTIESRIDWTLGSLTIENLVLAGSAVRGTGHAGANRITGNALANQLDGAAGADTLVGGQGNDSYQIDNAGDRVIEAAGEGTDTVTSLVSHTLAANVESLVLGGTAAINGTGNTLNNLITGNAAANVLNGGGGTDTLRGGAGNDTYDVGASSVPVIVETSTGGTDLVRSASSITLASYVENLTLTGTEHLTGTGNGLANLVIGNAGDNTLDGGTGTDTLKGGAGNDVYIVDRSTDVVYEVSGQGYDDEIRASVSYTLSANVENLTLTGTANINGTGSAQNNYLTGNAGNNRLDGGDGIDIYIASAGDDTYVIDNDSESILDEDITGGNDTIEVDFSYSLESHFGIENLVVTGSFDDWLVGNELDNRLTGNAGANTLEGGAGADTLIGGAGNDLFQVVSGEDVVIEASGGGIDTVEIVGGSAPYTLASYIENLKGYGQLTGNGLANHIEGGWGSDTINGGAGADTMEGGYDDDTYYIDNAGDLIIDSYGLSTVFSGISYTAGTDMQVRVNLQGSANLNATGLASGCELNGNSGNNLLTGGLNGDHRGGAGNDTFIVGDYSHVWEDGGAGYDIVKTVGCGFDLSMTYSEIEEIRLDNGNFNATGNLWNNLLVGGAGDNRLNGGTGFDTASFSNATAGVSVDLGAGTATGFGNDTLINIDAIIGSSRADTLRGGEAADTFTGGGGADRFQFDNLVAADVLTDFVHGSDLLQIVQSGLHIGDGDTVVDGAVTITTPGGHAAAAELVVASTALSGSITASAVAGAIGPATGAYDVGQTAVFVVHNATDSAVYLFTSAGHDASISTGELTRLAWLNQQTALTTTDFGFVG